MKNINLSCVIYIRVSDKTQTLGNSLDDQERTCRAFAERNGYTVKQVYRDDGRSAYKDEVKHRPQFEKLLNEARWRRWQAVIVYKLDRFARKARVYHNGRWQLEQAGVQLLSASEPNEESAAGRLSSGMLAQFAEFYSAQLSERIKAAQAGKAARGMWVGPPPFGYDLVARELRPGRWWLWVVAIFVGYAKGATTVDLAKALNAAGVPLRSGRPWTKDSVLMVLRNAAYIGKGGGRSLAAYDAGHKPVVTPALWEAVQGALGARGRRPRGPRLTPRPAPLTFVARCALCGGKMHRARSAKNSYLRCRGATNRTCAARAVPLDLVEHQVNLLRQSGAKIATVFVQAGRGIERFEAS